MDKNTIIPEIQLPDDEFELEENIDESEEEASQEKETETAQEEINVDVEWEEEELVEGEDPRLKDLYNYYRENNIITQDADGPITPEKFEEIIVNQRKAEIEHYMDLPIKSASPDAQAFLKYARDNPNATLDDLKQFFEEAEKIFYYSEDNLKEESTAENYLRRLYKDEDYEDNEIDERIDMLKDSKSITKEALREYKRDSVAKQEYLNHKLKEVEQSKEAQQVEYDTFVDSFNQELKNLQWNDSRKSKVVEVFSSGLYKSAIENMTSMPKAMIQLLDIISYLDVDKGEIDLSAYLGREETKVTKRVKNKILDSFSTSLGRQSAAVKNDNDKFDDFEFAD
jgi:hypothetical protein